MKVQRRNKVLGLKAMCVAALAAFGAVLTADAAGLIKPVGAAGEGPAIKTHDVNVVLNNGFARTEVDQVFVNETDQDYEAIYSFPLPKQASLSELSLWVDGQELLGEVVPKEKAREVYEEQLAQGNDTALAEKDDFKTFEVSIGRVRAHDETRVRLVYYQPLEIDLNVGRYLYPLAEGNVDEERIAFWSVDDRVTGTFSFDLTLKSAFPVKDVRVPGYDQEARITDGGTGEVDGEEEAGDDAIRVRLDRAEGASLSRDIVVYYRLDDTVPARVEVVPYKESAADEGTVMVVVTPAASLQRIAEGTDWTFVLDVSGSMGGHKIQTLADGVVQVLGKMSPQDRYRIVTFNNRARDLTGGYVTATPGHIAATIEQIRSVPAGGGTALFAGLEKAYRGLDDDRTAGILLVTDGVANVGPTQHKAFLKLLEQVDIRLFTFVIGNSANQPLMERLARDSGGFAMNISDADDIVGRLVQAKAKVLHECMHDVELTMSGEKVTDITPAKLGNLYLGQQVVVFGRYQGAGEVNLVLKAKISGEQKTWRCSVDLPDVDQDNPELERLWALSVIDETMEEIREKGEQEAWRKQVEDLGVEYSLVTDYTSMLVVKGDVLENEHIDRRNLQRVERERKAQARRQGAPVKSYRVDSTGNNPPQGSFGGASSPGIGSGPVGPLMVGLLALVARRRKN